MAVIPSGTSEPWFWAAREAAANDALARLFISLAAQRERSREHMQNQRELLELRDRYTRGIYEDYGAPGTRGGGRNTDAPYYPENNPLGPGAAGSGRTAPAAPSSAPPKLIPGAQPLGPGVGTFTPTPQQTSELEVDESDGTTTTLSAQSRQPQAGAAPVPAQPYAPKSVRTTTEPTQLPRQPRVSGGGQRQSAAFVPIRPEVLQAWNAAEKKYGLPQGMLLTLLGMENSGGRNLNRNPQSSGGAEGIFQFTRDLRKEYNIPDSDLRDPIKMGDWAARNMRRNADAFTKLTGQKLGNTQDDVLDYALLHQFGIGDGPRIVAATRLNPDMRMSDAMLKLNGRDNYRVLVNNGIPGNASVKAVVDSHGKRIAPWQSAAIKLQDNPEATSSTATTAPPSAGGDDGGDASTFLDSRSRGARIAGLDPVFTDRLAAAAKEAEEATGHRIQINSGHRTTAEQADIFRRSGGGRRFLAAPPGRSRHESGAAADIAHGPALDWLHQNRGYIARKYGIDFLRGRAFGRDPVHVQMIPGRVDPNVRFFKPTQVAQEAPKPPELPSMRGTDNLTQYSQPSAPIATADVFGGTRTNPQVMADIPLPRSQPDVATPDIPDAAAAQAKPQPTQELERPQVNPTVQAQPQSYVTDDEARAAMQRPGQPGAGVQAVGSAMQSIRELARKYARGGTGEDTRNVTADEAQRVPSTALQAGEPDNPFMPVDRPMVSVGTLLDKFSAQPQRDIPAPRGAELYGQPSVPRPDERYAPPVAQYSPGQLDPDTIRQMEEMILNRRSEATPPDTRGSVIDNVRDFLNKMYVGGGIENEMGYFGQENIPTAAPKVVAPKPIPVAPPRSVKTLAIGPNGEVLEPEVEQQPLGPAFVPKKQQGAPPPVTGPIPMAPAPGAGGAAPKPQGIQRIPDPNNPGKFIYRTPDETQFMEGDDGQFPLAELDPLAEEVTFG